MLKDFLLKVVLLVIIVLLVVLVVLKRRETFFVAYNSQNVPINKQQTLDESDVVYLNNALNKYNTSSFPNTYDYVKYTRTKKDKLPLPLSNKVQDLISEKVITTLMIINKGDRLEIRKVGSKPSEEQPEAQLEPFYDLYWKVIDNNIHCVFKMDIKNKEKGWSRTFKIYVVVKTGKEGNVDIIIKTISLEEFSYLPLEGINQNDEGPNYYKIENTLRLMDPYLTSGKEMEITDSMKKNFNNALNKKYLT